MPDLAARFAIASGLPPLDLLVYQIHMPLPSNGEPAGVVSGSGVLIGAGIVGVGSSRAAYAGVAAASAERASAAARTAPRRRAGFAAPAPPGRPCPGFAAPAPPGRPCPGFAACGGGATWRSTGFAAALTALSPSHRLRGELTGSR